jgi:predicted CopG family antitoxin
MKITDKLTKKEKLIQKTIMIDDNLYTRLENLSKHKYDESISKIINICIYNLSETNNINICDSENELLVKHTVIFREGALQELEKLKNKYKLSIFRLVNIAIRNAIDELEN